MDEDIHHEEKNKLHWGDDDEEVTVLMLLMAFHISRDESMNDTDVSIFMTWRNNT
jgi:hypothetical protein